MKTAVFAVAAAIASATTVYAQDASNSGDSRDLFDKLTSNIVEEAQDAASNAKNGFSAVTSKGSEIFNDATSNGGEVIDSATSRISSKFDKSDSEGSANSRSHSSMSESDAARLT
ncbi:hypothetical protein EV182_002643, partial [Spiromyces aspiralis]